MTINGNLTPGHANAQRLAALLAERFPEVRTDVHLIPLDPEGVFGGEASIELHHEDGCIYFGMWHNGVIGVSIEPHGPFRPSTVPDKYAGSVEEALETAAAMLAERGSVNRAWKDTRIVVGERSDFAIEWEFFENPHGPWMFGRFCYWIGATRVGDFNQVTSLRDVLMCMEEVAQRPTGNREHMGLWEMPPFTMFELVDRAIYGDADEALARRSCDEQWRRFCVCPNVDVMDGLKIFAVASNGSTRLVVSKRPYRAELLHHEVSTAAFEKAIDETVEGLVKAYESLANRSWNS